jgi:hypothetical protein
MNEEIRVSVSLPEDSDGFFRRECPACERQFKWFGHSAGSPDSEPVDQYFCPLCGAVAGADSWWTPAQLEYARELALPEAQRLAMDMMKDAFKGVQGVTFTANDEPGSATAEPLSEPDDMMIAEPPCHRNEPVKVPQEAAGNLHCIICGSLFAV